MKNLIRKILIESIDQRVINTVYKHLVDRTPIVDGMLNTSRINNDVIIRQFGNSSDITNFDNIHYLVFKSIRPYLDKFGLEDEEINLILQKYFYEHAYLGGNGPWPGDTIVLEFTDDSYTHLKKGDKGEFSHYDGIGNLRISWQNGSNLSMIPDVDRFTFIRK